MKWVRFHITFYNYITKRIPIIKRKSYITFAHSNIGFVNVRCIFYILVKNTSYFTIIFPIL